MTDGTLFRLSRYRPPGPVANAFLQCQGAPFASVMGPIGGGKTSANFVKHVYNAHQQAPSSIDGRRKYRLAVIRDTYRNLWSTTMRSWHYWIPASMGDFVGGENQPAVHKILFRPADKIVIEFEVLFRAIGDLSIETALQGLEVTGFFLNEADKLSEDVLIYCSGRTGRWPKMDEGGPSWHGITADYNAPDTDSYLYKMREEERPPGYKMFRQPSGLSPKAENLANLPPGYYENQVVSNPRWYVKRFVENQYGHSREGLPVYEDYDDEMHGYDGDLEPDERLPLILGGDAGRKPAVIILQEMPSGQWRALDELQRLGMGAERFGEQLNRLLAEERYRAWSDVALADGLNARIRGWGDPSADYVSADTSEESWLEIMQNVTKIRWRAAAADNDLTIRLGVVEHCLQRIVGGQPGLLVSKRCKLLRKGFMSHYRYRKRRQGNTEYYDDKPEKNLWSNPQDALGYGLLGEGEGTELLGRRAAQRQGGPVQTGAITADNPAGDWDSSGAGPYAPELLAHRQALRRQAFGLGDGGVQTQSIED